MKKEKSLADQRKLPLKQLLAERQKAVRSQKFAARSLFIRHLDCGSCNACELELIALSNPIYDAARWGIRFEASPRHADVLALTGPYVRSLHRAALKTLEAMPVPRIITIGDCAGKSGEFENAYGVMPYPDEIRQAIIAHVPGCPPEPQKILEVLLNCLQEE